jgi:hypothetical protein
MTRRIPTILGFCIAGLVIAVVTGWRALDAVVAEHRTLVLIGVSRLRTPPRS